MRAIGRKEVFSFWQNAGVKSSFAVGDIEMAQG